MTLNRTNITSTHLPTEQIKEQSKNFTYMNYNLTYIHGLQTLVLSTLIAMLNFSAHLTVIAIR